MNHAYCVDCCIPDPVPYSRWLRFAGVYFGQLLGMADHLSFSLGRAGFRAHKILPYGPVPETLQYLLRRAQENSDFKGGCAKEARAQSPAILGP